MNASFMKMNYADFLSETMAFLKATEENSRLLYIEKPNLEKQYKVLIGNYESSIMEMELEAELMQRKVELIQAAINRREPIDMDAIDAMLEQEKQTRLAQINGAGCSDSAIIDNEEHTKQGELSAEELDELQHLYKDIITQYHPELNPGATAIQKELFAKALEAYKNKDLDALKLIHGMLFEDLEDMELALEVSPGSCTADDSEAQCACKKATPDFSVLHWKINLSAKLLRLKRENIHQKLTEIMEANENLQKGFPFTAKEVIFDEAKRNEYLSSLRFREEKAKRDISDFTQRINEMVGEQAHG